MKLRKYIADLQKLTNDYPDLEVVYSADDEGNYYGKVEYSPSLGHYDHAERSFGQGEDENSKALEINAVCIN